MKEINIVRNIIYIFQIFTKKPKVSIAVLLLAFLTYPYEVMIARPKMVYMGIPSSTSFNLNHFNRIFRNSSFMVGYSDYRGNPLWVTYKLSQIPSNSRRLKRPSSFSSDWRNITSIKQTDYTNSGYDRGHLAPNYAISRLYGKEAQKSTFLMTNISPQKPNLNRKIWQRLEEVEVKYFTKKFKKIWVTTGPIFDKKITKLKSSDYVEIPDAFYKIFVGVNDNQEPKMLALIIPQTVKGYEPFSKFVVTVDKVEELSGFDFFSKLDDRLESKLEASKDMKPWQLKSFDSMKSRY